MQLITISGNLGRDGEVRDTGSDKVLSFSVGVKQGWGDRASTNWFRCNVWGKRADSLAPHLTKGTKVFVTGELTIGEYQGKPQYDVRVSEVDFASAGGERRTASPPPARGGPTYGGADYQPDLDDDVPF